MSMLNQAAVEALCSATYLENYFDTMENLPDDLQKIVTQLRELDIQCRDILQDIDNHQEVYGKEPEGPTKKKALLAIQRALIKCQEIGDEKLHLMAMIIEHIDNRGRQLEQDRENLDPMFGKETEKEEKVTMSATTTTTSSNATTTTSSKPIIQHTDPKPEKVAVKRQRRQKTNDTVIKEEEKKIKICVDCCPTYQSQCRLAKQIKICRLLSNRPMWTVSNRPKPMWTVVQQDKVYVDCVQQTKAYVDWPNRLKSVDFCPTDQSPCRLLSNRPKSM
ncbi:Inhibitor of growth protein 1 [Mizuhopecten yessoensis]|uniref:Inhibitor of growth protein 1 n=1 Tax=Mizuhopecten yessoensis TaxID=6573 RepID=A0A210QYY2_MIZYE|nr:Inhibitor of growth protein 1 [Mizuhopecten yessoensis]